MMLGQHHPVDLATLPSPVLCKMARSTGLQAPMSADFLSLQEYRKVPGTTSTVRFCEGSREVRQQRAYIAGALLSGMSLDHQPLP